MPGSKPRAAKCCIWGFISTEYELATFMVEKNTEVQRTEMSCSVPAPCPSGGSLSEVYLHGANLVTEGVRQIRGTSPNQIADARNCFISTCDSTPNGALILRRQ